MEWNMSTACRNKARVTGNCHVLASRRRSGQLCLRSGLDGAARVKNKTAMSLDVHLLIDSETVPASEEMVRIFLLESWAGVRGWPLHPYLQVKLLLLFFVFLETSSYIRSGTKSFCFNDKKVSSLLSVRSNVLIWWYIKFSGVGTCFISKICWWKAQEQVRLTL